MLKTWSILVLLKINRKSPLHILNSNPGACKHITMMPWYARWRLKSPALRLFTQPFIRSKKTSKLRATGLCDGNSPVNSPHKGPVTRKMFPFDDIIMHIRPRGLAARFFARKVVQRKYAPGSSHYIAQFSANPDMLFYDQAFLQAKNRTSCSDQTSLPGHVCYHYIVSRLII